MEISERPITITSSLDQDATQFVSRILEANPQANREIIHKAFCFSWDAHRKQLRKSGEPFLAHPAAVALILAEQQLDSTTIAAGLLHDVVEDTPITRAQIAAEFGEEIAMLVDGVTKIQKFQMRSREERQAESYRKMLLSMAKDIRVIVIKFADRLHNLRTLGYLEPEKIQLIADETINIYAPLAHRLGMARIKWEMEDLAFRFLYPAEYKDIVTKVVGSRVERDAFIDSFANPLHARFAQEGVEATITGRPKHFYSIYRKMVQRSKPFEEIFDLLAIRVITKSVAECYHVLGIIHSLWRPFSDRFKDYISTPKSNGYQSLHTTVFGEKGQVVEIQIRTWEMHQVAEDGIAAHWLYKEDGGTESAPTKDDHTLNWLKNIIEWQKDLTDSAEFFEFFKIDLYQAEIFIFTPKGDLMTLPKGATVLDFAFSVHTALGLHCIGGKVDGKIEPINKVLKSGTTVEILSSMTKKPSVNWLREVRTPKARSAIRRWLKTTSHQESIELGKKIVSAQYKKMHLASSFSDEIPALLQFFGVSNIDQLYESVGNGDLSVTRIATYLHSKKVKKDVPASVVSRIVSTFTGKSPGITIGGADHLMVRFANCCNPIPNDPIIGFVTRGRGISVHRKNCSNVKLFGTNEERAIEVSWDNRSGQKYIVSFEVLAEDRTGLLHEISEVFYKFGSNVLDCSLSTLNQQVTGRFRAEIQNRNQFKQIIKRIQKIKGVEKVVRTKNYTNASADEQSEQNEQSEQDERERLGE